MAGLGYGNDIFTDIPFYLSEQFGFDVAMGIYADLKRLGIPEDEIFNQKNKDLIILKKKISDLSILIQNQSAYVNGDINQLTNLTGVDVGLKDGLNFLSSISVVAKSAVELGLVAADKVAILGATSIPYFAIAIQVFSYLEGVVTQNRINQIAESVKTRISYVKDLTEQLIILLNKLPKQVEPIKLKLNNNLTPPVTTDNTQSLLIIALVIVILIWYKKTH